MPLSGWSIKESLFTYLFIFCEKATISPPKYVQFETNNFLKWFNTATINNIPFPWYHTRTAMLTALVPGSLHWTTGTNIASVTYPILLAHVGDHY